MAVGCGGLEKWVRLRGGGRRQARKRVGEDEMNDNAAVEDIDAMGS